MHYIFDQDGKLLWWEISSSDSSDSSEGVMLEIPIGEEEIIKCLNSLEGNVNE